MDITEEKYQQQIESLNIKIYNAEDKVRDLKKQKQDLFISRYKDRTGLKEGDVVTWKEWVNHKGEVVMKGRINGFEVSFDRVQPCVWVYKKDGSEGLRMRNYWNGTTQPVKV